MRRSCFWECLIVGMIVTTGTIGSGGELPSAPRSNPLGEKNFFPIGVWLQNPAKAQRYREAGFNLYVYPLYLKGCDIASFDIYPVTHRSEEVAGNLFYVARGVKRLVDWTGGEKPVWNCIECTRISHPTKKPTPHQVRCEVWMALIHGSTGLIYFVHEWQPRFNESALLSDPEMYAAVTRIN